ncbi:hypothetical protein GQ457_03G034090 [Hibiscus cannabinus]
MLMMGHQNYNWKYWFCAISRFLTPLSQTSFSLRIIRKATSSRYSFSRSVKCCIEVYQVYGSRATTMIFGIPK